MEKRRKNQAVELLASVMEEVKNGDDAVDEAGQLETESLLEQYLRKDESPRRRQLAPG